LENAKEAEKNETVAYRMYLGMAPRIENTTDIQQCGKNRAYFGFDPSIAIDRQICDDVKQLRLTRDFEILNTFAKGSGGRKAQRADKSLTMPGIRKSRERYNVRRKINIGSHTLHDAYSFFSGVHLGRGSCLADQ
jgi:hypothetical protein